jgi:hypothetical protein
MLEREEQELWNGWGVRKSYGPRTWSVSLLPSSTNCLKSSTLSQFCINPWRRFFLTSQWDGCQGKGTAGRLIKPVKTSWLWQKLDLSCYLSFIFEALESHFHLDGDDKLFANFYSSQDETEDCVPASCLQPRQTFKFKSDQQPFLVRGRIDLSLFSTAIKI